MRDYVQKAVADAWASGGSYDDAWDRAARRPARNFMDEEGP